MVDLAGKRFGSLTVLELTEKRINQNAVWLCRCDCGNLCEVSYPQLVRGIVNDCGCESPDRDLTGRRFGKLTVTEAMVRSRYRCTCDCGNELTVTAHELLSDHKKSCGCLKMNPKAEDITGMRSGMVIALERTDQKRRNCYLWRCKCDCGNELLLEAYKIRNGIIQSCGCQRHVRLIKDLTGMKFGKLTALERLDEKIGTSYAWRCICECGNETKVSANALLRGGTKSCGCGKIEAVKENIRKYGGVVDYQHFVDGTCVEKIESSYKLRSNNTSGYTGVQIRGDRYVALITFKKKVYYLGSYTRIEDAVKARKRAEGMLFEPFLDWFYNERNMVRGSHDEKNVSVRLNEQSLYSTQDNKSNEGKKIDMNKKELIAEIAKRTSTTQKEAEKGLNAFCEIISEELIANRKVQILGFGSFEVRERAARTGKNPRTGEMVEIQASKAPLFKAGKALKDSVNV